MLTTIKGIPVGSPGGQCVKPHRKCDRHLLKCHSLDRWCLISVYKGCILGFSDFFSEGSFIFFNAYSAIICQMGHYLPDPMIGSDRISGLEKEAK